MKQVVISAFAAIALLTAATTMLRSHSPSSDRLVGAAGMPTLQQLQSSADAKKLPAEQFEDQSLVYSTVAKH
jgi:hypothetical protein